MADKLVSIKGSVPVNKHKWIGHADSNDRIEATIKLRRASEEGLPTLEEFVRGKRSSGITRQILAERYGAKREDVDAVQRWAVRQALSVSRVDLARRQMHLVGSVDAMSRAFGVKLSMYRHSRTGSQFRCPEKEIKVPESLAPIITGVFGLNDMPVVVRHAGTGAATKAVKVGKKDPKAQFPGSFYPNEVAKLYNFPPAQGVGQRVAVLEFGGGIDPSVLADYFKNSIGLDTPPVVNPISVLNAPIKVDEAATGEVYLDIEVIGAMAPKATMDVYFAPWTGEGYLNAIEQAIHNDDYAAVSISYGLDEDLRGAHNDPGWPGLNQHIDEAFRDATALGIPIFVSSGDQGSSSLRGQVKVGSQPVEVTQYSPAAHAGYPASSPYATAVGGTMLYAENGAISKEIVWNELGPLQQNQFYFGGATGGGVSDRYTEVPTYQSNAGVVPTSINKAGVKGRGIPDVAGNAGSTTGYLVSQPPGAPLPVMPVGGTSAAAPMWAALMCCAREVLEAKFNGKVPTFFLNDFVYESGKTAAFRDITGGREFTLDAKGRLTPGAFTALGTNRSTKANGYQASPGFDLCTGWGSPNGVELVNQLEKWLASGKSGGNVNKKISDSSTQ